MGILAKFLGDPNEKIIKSLEPVVKEINGLESRFEKMSDEELKGMTKEFRERLGVGKEAKPLSLQKGGQATEATESGLASILPEAFAVVREAAKRVLGQRHFDVQLVGGIVLHRGQIAEMRTGEGKTLVATLPLYLNGLAGQGVHLVTVNDYLSRVGAGWMAPVYHLLGLSTGVIVHDAAFCYDPEFMDDSQYDERLKHFRKIERKEAYRCDITYGTNNEFGFDYLKDNMVPSLERMVQRDLYYSIVDEIDSILIDEARTPLIISAPAEESTDKYYKFSQLVERLKEKEDYNVDEKMRAATLTEAAIAKMEKWLGVENIYVAGGIRDVHHIEQALKARVLFKKDRDYVVKEGQIIIVDEFTGRLMFGRRYSEGLHQAIEAKEGVPIQRESQTLATITFQNYFRMYKKLSGMTGTAVTEAEEFAKIYNLETVVMPTHKPMIRRDLNDLIYRTEEGKFKAVIENVKERLEKGQPVLIGTISIEKNELLVEMMAREGLDPQVLNAKNHEKEAQIIAQAGKLGTITIATNMAGRGVDIILGGNPPDKEEQEKVIQAGGLHVLGTERHEARRIDNQLRGRSGRQGDPGSSQFYVSTDDDLMRIFGGDRMKSLMKTLRVPEDMPIENKIVSKSIESAQKKVEGNNFDIRKHLVEYDDVINKHRETIYRKRRAILEPAENKITNYPPEADQPLADKLQITRLPKPPPALLRQPDKMSFLAGKAKRAGGTRLQCELASGQAGGQANKAQNPNNQNDKIDGKNDSKTLSGIILEMVENEIEQVVSFHTAVDDIKSWNLAEIYEVAATIFPVEKKLKDDLSAFASEGGKLGKAQARTAIIEHLVKLAKENYEKIKEQFKTIGTGFDFSEIEKTILIRSIDTLWIEHLDAMDYMRRGIGLRGYGQRDPLVEYKKEAYHLFNELNSLIQKEVVYSIFKVGDIGQFKAPSLVDRARQFSAPAKTMDEKTSSFSGFKQADKGSGSGTIDMIKPKLKNAEGEKIGRNDPCPCGAKKPDGTPIKYKHCHGK